MALKVTTRKSLKSYASSQSPLPLSCEKNANGDWEFPSPLFLSRATQSTELCSHTTQPVHSWAYTELAAVFPCRPILFLYALPEESKGVMTTWTKRR